MCIRDCVQLTQLCALTHVYSDADTCPGTLTRVRAFTPMPINTYNMPTGTDVCAHLKYRHAYVVWYVVHVCIHECTYIRAYTYVSMHVCTGGLIRQTNLRRGSAPPWLDLPEMLWN